ncbi:hypothetical protein ACJRO7_017604 [Eucalyptus globulus]|uniref:RRM domain-containing protein n=1 Tax=Eucalyptus globulus TaxID=34317 RepID=A0ABD3KQQ5_EUCGL
MMQPSATGMVPPPLDQQQQQQQYQYQQQPSQQPPPQPQPYMMMPPAGHPSQAPPPPQMWAAHQPLPAMPQQAAPGGGGGDEVRTLWIGDLQYWMDEAYLTTCFATTGEVANVKVIRNKQTMQPEGYGFIEFYTRAAAERVLQTYNGAIMPNGGQSFRLNWASAGEKRADDTPDYTIFVGDLASDVTDYMLQEMFRGRYPSVRSAKVVMDRLTSRTKGYGFVKFGDESEQIRAMSEMNGVFLSTRPMRIGLATNKKIATGQQYQKASYQNTQVTPNETDPNNKTVNFLPHLPVLRNQSIIMGVTEIFHFRYLLVV